VEFGFIEYTGLALIVIAAVVAFGFMYTTWPFNDDDLIIGSVCGQCNKPIYKHDDDAEICINCGGLNRRIYQYNG